MTLSIERRGARWGDRTAVVDVSEADLYAPAATVDEDRVTYAELAALARTTAGALADRGVGAGDVVAVLSRNRIATLALVFACRRLGATLAPVSHRLTPATVDRPLERLAPTLVIHERGQRDLVRAVPGNASVALDELGEAAARDPALGNDGAGEATPVVGSAATDGRVGDAPLLALHGEDGTPVARFDGAAVEWNCVTAVATRGLGRADRTTILRPLSSADGLLGVALPVLYAGGRLAIDRAFDPADAVAATRRENATFLAGRAAAFRDLLACDGIDDALAALEWIAWEGSVDETVASGYRERGVPVARTYGRLECPNALSQSLGDGDPVDAGVGTPVLDCDARLVDDGEDVTGPGEGTLRLAGPVLASGYADGSAADDSSAGFAGGWFDTGERFRRDERGRYHPIDADEE
ncbi:AMP-binding protein [Halovivax sp.]|uniref:AMP-binding protein n=1 Tax=Halovivax sp. TaxID=1935978 RepID=UPI0025C4C9BA|nr:AMP-binding protein [Halovivax sp.]